MNRIKLNQKVTLDRKQIAPSLAAILPNFIFWNEGTVTKTCYSKTVKRLRVEWSGHDALWFDVEALAPVAQ